MINIKGYQRFILVIIIAHTLSYIIAGGIAYQLIQLGFIKMQPEMILYSILVGIMIAQFSIKKEKK